MGVLLAGEFLAGSAAAQLQWEQRPLFGRSTGPIAYDVNRARLVHYAGTSFLPTGPETWEWDGVAWQKRSPALMPPMRWRHSLAHDQLRGRTVLFGGGNGSSYLNDTWEWDGTTWSAMASAALPPARANAGMAFDATRGRMVLFGGSTFTPQSGGSLLADTWEWDGVNWVQRAPAASPPARAQHGMSYDLLRSRVVLFGGTTSSTLVTTSSTLRNDTWEWDGANWALMPSPQHPSPRSLCALAYDVGRNRTVLFGGQGPSTALWDTWEWNGTNWQMVLAAGPSPRREAGLAYGGGAVLMVGGGDDTHIHGDTWRWDGVQWTRLHSASAPSPRTSAAATWDRDRSVLLMFGGYGITGLPGFTGSLSDFWQWDGQSWLELQAQPLTPRVGAAMTYDSTRHRAVLFGGRNDSPNTALPLTAFGDTWEWDGANWQLATASGPSPRSRSAMAFDPIRGQTVLFGGEGLVGSTGVALSETWLWDGTLWQRRTLALEPSPRSRHVMAFDELRGVVVLFGGSGFNDTWEWNGLAWLQRTPVHAPPVGDGWSLAWDAARARIVLSGGDVTVWDWDGIDWQLRSTAPTPPTRRDPCFAYDRARERTVLFGGSSGVGAGTSLQYFADLWELGPVQPAHVTPFGIGCAGTLGTPLLDVVADGRPWLGDAVTLRLAPVPGGAFAMFALGNSNTQWSGVALPAPLDGLGMPGCTLFVGLDETFLAVGSGSTALLTATVPVQPALLGVSLYLQGAVFDPGANAAGIVVSNALAVVVGAR